MLYYEQTTALLEQLINDSTCQDVYNSLLDSAKSSNSSDFFNAEHSKVLFKQALLVDAAEKDNKYLNILRHLAQQHNSKLYFNAAVLKTIDDQQENMVDDAPNQLFELFAVFKFVFDLITLNLHYPSSIKTMLGVKQESDFDEYDKYWRVAFASILDNFALIYSEINEFLAGKSLGPKTLSFYDLLMTAYQQYIKKFENELDNLTKVSPQNKNAQNSFTDSLNSIKTSIQIFKQEYCSRASSSFSNGSSSSHRLADTEDNSTLAFSLTL